MSEVVTRFAPSPTGLLHAGNYRTAVFAYLYARKSDGKFIVRIEDTDKERSKPEFEDNIHETLGWLALVPDANYRQSGNVARHTAELQRLMEIGAAYLSKEEARAADWAGNDNVARRGAVIRFKNPNRPVTFRDAVRGEITMDTTDLGDFVIARSPSEPVFHFAVVVDDQDEGITHVIRGEDHISNTPRQILIQQALGYRVPVYAHLPLVLGPDRAKMSKRRGARALTEYRDLGYMPEAIINYLALLGWHPQGERELFTLEELVAEFDLARIQKGAGIFDEAKLRWFNHEHLKRLPEEVYADRLKNFAEKPFDPRLIPLVKERAVTLREAARALESEFDFLSGVSYDPALLLQGGKIEATNASEHLRAVADILARLPDEEFTASSVKEVVWPYAETKGRGAVLWPLRVALSGRERSPDPFTIAGLLGKREAVKRIAEAAHKL